MYYAVDDVIKPLGSCDICVVIFNYYLWVDEQQSLLGSLDLRKSNLHWRKE